MTSLFIYTPDMALAQWVQAALHASSALTTHTVLDSTSLVQQVLHKQPDVVLCCTEHPDEDFFSVVQRLADDAPCAVLALVNDPHAVHAARAMAAGIALYRTDACTPASLPALLHIAQARFAHQQQLHSALERAGQRLEERKVVDRAKLILMQARHMTDDDAYRVLRDASMHSNQRLGQVGQQVIASAKFAEGVNRAGQLRMLSQRLVMLYLFGLAGQRPGQPAVAEAAQRIDTNLAWLAKGFSAPELASAVSNTAGLWRQLHASLKLAPQAHEMARIDVLAEQLLDSAEALTAQLETVGAAAPLRVLNLAGRQRMLSQRYAKDALLGALGHAALAHRSAQRMGVTGAAFEQSLHYLHNVPLTSPDIRGALAAAKVQWQQLQNGADAAAHSTGRDALADASNALLTTFEQLSEHYESSLQMLLG